MANKYKVNDKVIIISGKDKGKTGIIKKILHKRKKVIIDGLNVVYKHQKSIPSNNIIGGIIKKESFIDISNISHICNQNNKISKIGFMYKNNKKIRYLKLNKLKLL